MLSLSEIRAAEGVVRQHFPATPLVYAPSLSELTGAQVYLKLECFTPLRTFKIRGALNKVHALVQAGGAAGVTTASAGNHGMAAAYAARAFGLPATIFVPEGANPQKISAIRRHGAEVVVTGHDYQAAFEACQAFAAQSGLTIVHAYDDPAVIAGQGTVGLELSAQLPDLDEVFVGIGGGGLIGGTAAALKELSPGVKVTGVSPVGADSLPQSVAAGRLVELDRVATFADGLSARRPGANTLALAQRYVDRFIRVSDEEIFAGMEALLRHERLVTEPAGAAVAAALLQGGCKGRRVALIVSGANIANHVFAELIARTGRA